MNFELLHGYGGINNVKLKNLVNVVIQEEEPVGKENMIWIKNDIERNVVINPNISDLQLNNIYIEIDNMTLKEDIKGLKRVIIQDNVLDELSIYLNTSSKSTLDINKLNCFKLYENKTHSIYSEILDCYIRTDIGNKRLDCYLYKNFKWNKIIDEKSYIVESVSSISGGTNKRLLTFNYTDGIEDYSKTLIDGLVNFDTSKYLNIRSHTTTPTSSNFYMEGYTYDKYDNQYINNHVFMEFNKKTLELEKEYFYDYSTGVSRFLTRYRLLDILEDGRCLILDYYTTSISLIIFKDATCTEILSRTTLMSTTSSSLPTTYTRTHIKKIIGFENKYMITCGDSTNGVKFFELTDNVVIEKTSNKETGYPYWFDGYAHKSNSYFLSTGKLSPFRRHILDGNLNLSVKTSENYPTVTGSDSYCCIYGEYHYVYTSNKIKISLILPDNDFNDLLEFTVAISVTNCNGFFVDSKINKLYILGNSKLYIYNTENGNLEIEKNIVYNQLSKTYSYGCIIKI